MIDDEMIKKYAPNVVEGVSKLSNWVKNLKNLLLTNTTNIVKLNKQNGRTHEKIYQ